MIAVTTTIPGYEELGSAMPLTMLLSVSWGVVAAYEQKTGRYGLLIHATQGEVVAFLCSYSEIDALCALIEFCVDLLSYWPTCAGIIEQWRSIWWMAQTAMTQQRLREVQP